MDFLLKSEIRNSLHRTRDLLNTKVLWDTSGFIFKRSVLIEVLINMKDLLIKSEKHINIRIDFSDDVLENKVLKIKDVTDLIKNFRDAVCHNDSFRRKFESSVASFGEISGKGGKIILGAITFENKYSDDITFIMGENKLYLKRHIERAFEELENNFKPHIDFY